MKKLLITILLLGFLYLVWQAFREETLPKIEPNFTPEYEFSDYDNQGKG